MRAGGPGHDTNGPPAVIPGGAPAADALSLSRVQER